ncbi:sulfur carrier protein ThiS [Algihabitans albus]|uniref:sulfur carrier protein ThiS n=1 Tax=Algihabitans albus TaxID=2164067 RepID=UPI0035D0EDA0
MIALSVNGEARRLAVDSVAGLLTCLQVDTGRLGVAVAVNDTVVRRADWATHPLAEGDRVEIVRPLRGG